MPQCCGTPVGLRTLRVTQDPHGTRDAYGTWGPPVTLDPHGTWHPHGTWDPHSTWDPRVTQDLYGVWHPHGTWDPCGTRDPHGMQHPYVTWDPLVPETPLRRLGPSWHPGPPMAPTIPMSPGTPAVAGSPVAPGTHGDTHHGLQPPCRDPLWHPHGPQHPSQDPTPLMAHGGRGGGVRENFRANLPPPHLGVCRGCCSIPQHCSAAGGAALLHGGCTRAWGKWCRCMGGGRGFVQAHWGGGALPHGGLRSPLGAALQRACMAPLCCSQCLWCRETLGGS